MRYPGKILWLTCLFFLAGCSYSCATQPQKDRSQQPPVAAGLKKLSPDLSLAYKNDDPNRKISVLVKTTTPLTPEQRKELSGRGIQVGTVSDNVFTAVLPLKAISFLADRPYIRYVELSKKLQLLN